MIGILLSNANNVQNIYNEPTTSMCGEMYIIMIIAFCSLQRLCERQYSSLMRPPIKVFLILKRHQHLEHSYLPSPIIWQGKYISATLQFEEDNVFDLFRKSGSYLKSQSLGIFLIHCRLGLLQKYAHVLLQ